MTTKVLIAGDAKGQLGKLMARAATVHGSKGPFDCLLCVGNFFGAASAAESILAPFISGESTVPLRTYVLGPPPAGWPEPADSDGNIKLCPNLYCLTGAGIVTLHGLRIAFACGRECADADGTPSALTDGVAELRTRSGAAGYVGCDLLLTHDWPRGFQRQLAEGSIPADVLPDRDLAEVGSERVAEIATSVRPRYHFCATEETFFQRAPYRQSLGSRGGQSVCRLICLASVANEKKQKWLHALALAPMATMGAEQLAAAPENTTDLPYPYAAAEPPSVPPAPAGGGDAEADSGRPAKRKRPEFAKEQRGWVAQSCWFCLASPQFESHLVVSIGEEVYACLAKGPLLPMHALLLPIAHTPCSLMLSEPETAELHRYTDALRRCFEARGATLLLFERYMGSGTFEHMHLQAIPLPAQLAAGAREAFERHGSKLGIQFEVLPPGETIASRMGGAPEPFFAATLPSGETLLHRLARNKRRHPLSFGREVIAGMLGNPRRADWKHCLPQPAPGERATTMELETRGADEFKRAFAPYDPSE